MAVETLDDAFARLDFEQRNERWHQQLVSLLRTASRARRHDLVHACLLTLARYEEQSARYLQALARWQRILTLDPQDMYALYTVGRLHFRLGNRKQALSAFERVLADTRAPNETRRWARGAIEGIGSARTVRRSSDGLHVHDVAQYGRGDHGTLGCILSEADELAARNPPAAEALVRRLRRRAVSVDDAFAQHMCDEKLAQVVAEPRRRVALLRNQLHESFAGGHPTRRRANLLGQLAIAERELGWTKAANKHRTEALALAEDDPTCEPLRRSLGDNERWEAGDVQSIAETTRLFARDIVAKTRCHES